MSNLVACPVFEVLASRARLVEHLKRLTHSVYGATRMTSAEPTTPTYRDADDDIVGAVSRAVDKTS